MIESHIDGRHRESVGGASSFKSGSKSHDRFRDSIAKSDSRSRIPRQNCML